METPTTTLAPVTGGLDGGQTLGTSPSLGTLLFPFYPRGCWSHRVARAGLSEKAGPSVIVQESTD